MPNAMEELMRLHPAWCLGRREHRPTGLEVFEELESRHPRPRHECDADAREVAWLIGDLAAAATMLIVLVGVLTVILSS